jgi:2-oxoglutarate dehydrogenase E2 component (dihydrolipoamide succinyltransferase)
MSLELKVPPVGESVHEVQIGQWLKHEGDRVEKDQPLVEIETDKATLEVSAPAAGQLSKILKHEGESCEVGEVIGYVEATGQPQDQGPPADQGHRQDKGQRQNHGKPPDATTRQSAPPQVGDAPWVTPSARRALAHFGLTVQDVAPAAAGGRLREEDVLQFAREHAIERTDGRQLSAANSAATAPGTNPPRTNPPATIAPPTTAPATTPTAAESARAAAPTPAVAGSRQEEVVPMSLLRRRIAARLVEAQQTAALLTTFNEIDMAAVVALRREHRETFQEKHAVKLGFMSFFVKAAIEALKRFPQVNAEVRETSIVYRNYFDIGIAVSSGRGLVVPVLRDAQRMSFAEIERAIADFSARAEGKKLTPEELDGGTFTISNGGVFGSLLSTPIVNPPQSGVLGLHAIEDRPVARSGQVVIRPMMYVALTYDHRVVDGREAVGFLRHVKEIVEEPARMLLEI